MRINEIIKKKRDGHELGEEEINYFVSGYTNGQLPDYQISSLLMAIFINKMNEKETFFLTKAMVESGDMVDLSMIKGIKVDKHSTGGVGDSVTLILGPMIAASDLPFVKMSGRGLGHTGGTLDKLESIDDFNVNLANNDFVSIANRVNMAICSQTANITPADKKFYSLRDVTGTVENISLIASSIMSKKLAIGSDAIVLDVKVGSGAFMKTKEDAQALAREMVKIGKNYGRKTLAVLSNMDQPLGRAIGNALEVKEVVETLKGEGPEDLLEIALFLGSQLLILGNKARDEDEARSILLGHISSGKAYKKFIEFVGAQNGDIEKIKNLDLLPKANNIIEVKSIRKGYVGLINAEAIGESALLLGAGRERLDSKIDMAAGIILNKKIGDKVELNESLATIHTNNLDNLELVKEKIINTYKISDRKPSQGPLILDLID